MVFPSLDFSKFGSIGVIIQSILALGSMPILFVHSVSKTIIIPEPYPFPFFAFVTWSIVTLLVSNLIKHKNSTKSGKDCHYCEGGKTRISGYTCMKCGAEQ